MSPSWPGAQRRRPVRRRVAQRVGEQVGQHPLEQARVGEHQRQPVGHVELQRLAGVVQTAQRDRRHLVDRGRAQERLQRAGVQAAHVEQVADQRVEPVRVLLDRGQQRRLVGSGSSCTSVCRRLLTLALIEASGVRRSWLTAREQRGAHPVALGQRLGLGGLGAQPLPVQRGGGLGGEAGQQPA